jgi:hypothetical protein
MTLAEAVAGCATVGLPELVERAARMRRFDRKYFVPAAIAADIVAELASSHRVLRIGCRRATSYRSVYFDSHDLRCCRDHLQGRRLRWKVRQRLYVEDGLCRLEVKLAAARGGTEKHAVEIPRQAYGAVDDADRRRILQALRAGGVEEPRVGSLWPVLETVYRRVTLVDLDAGTRVTIDSDSSASAAMAAVPPLRPDRVVVDPAFVIVETKGEQRVAPVDRLLYACGQRPISFSKYVTAAALLAPHVPDNLVRHHCRRHVHVVRAAPSA